MPSTAPISLRAAETQDIPRISAVIIAAMDYSPHWTWRFPYRKQFPDVHRQKTEEVIADYVKKSKDGMCVVMVAETEIEVEVDVETEINDPTAEQLLLGSNGSGSAKGKKPKKEKQRRREIVGVSIAQLPGTFVEPMTRIIKRTVPDSSEADKKAPRPPPGPFRADGHLERAKAFGAEFGPAKKRYFDVPYGNNQLYIDFMAVDPAYHRRGIATLLLEWMLELARREEDAKAVTLFSSPMGMGLYKKSGFEEVGVVTVKLEGDEGEGMEGVSAPVLVWKKG